MFSIIMPSFDIILFQDLIYEDLQHLSLKLFLVLFLNNYTTETILRSNAANFSQIFANFQKYWNIAMSNDGSSIKIIDQSHGD